MKTAPWRIGTPAVIAMLVATASVPPRVSLASSTGDEGLDGPPSTDPREHARQLVRSAEANCGRDSCASKQTPWARVSRLEKLKRAQELWPDVPDARAVEALYRVVSLTTQYNECDAPDARKEEDIYSAAAALVKEEMRLNPEGKRAQEVMDLVNAKRAELKKSAQLRAEYKSLAAKLEQKRGRFDEFPSAGYIIGNLKAAKGRFINFCVGELDADIQEAAHDEKDWTFDLRVAGSRYTGTAPVVVAKSMSESGFPPHHLLVRIEGVMDAVDEDGARYSIPLLRVVAAFDGRTTLLQGK